MEYRVLAIGDVVGETGLAHLERHLRSLQKLKNIDFTVVNGENASGVGLTPEQAERIYDAGADVITLGNHTFGKMQIADFLDDAPYILRPANYTGRAPGRGWAVYDRGGVAVQVVNLIGRCDLNFNAENPFTTMDKILERQSYVDSLAKEYHAEGLIYQQLKFCDYWGYERASAFHVMREEYGYPVLSLDRPYVVGNSGQVRTRVQAFVESLEIKRNAKG